MSSCRSSSYVRPVLGACVAALLLAPAAAAQRRADATGYAMYGGLNVYDSDVGPALRVGVLYEGAPADLPFRLRGEFEYQRIVDDPGTNVLGIIGSAVFYFPRSSGRGKSNVYGITGFGPYIFNARGNTDTEFGFHFGAGYQSRRGGSRPFYEGRLTFVDDVVALGGAIGFRF